MLSDLTIHLLKSRKLLRKLRSGFLWSYEIFSSCYLNKAYILTIEKQILFDNIAQL